MTRLKQRIQFERRPDVYMCYCGEYLYLTVTRDLDDKQVYVAITGQPIRAVDRLKAAWSALRGKAFDVSSEVVIDGQDLASLRDALTLEKPL